MSEPTPTAHWTTIYAQRQLHGLELERDALLVQVRSLVEEPGTALPARLLVGGYPVLLADHCELADRVAALEARIAQLEAGAVRVIDARLLGY